MASLGSFDLIKTGGIEGNHALAGLAFFLLGVQFVANILALFAAYASRPAPSTEKVAGKSILSIATARVKKVLTKRRDGPGRSSK